VYNYITKLCRIQAEITLNHVNPNVCGTGQGESRHRKYMRLKPGGGQAYDCTPDELQFQSSYIRHNLLHKPALHETTVHLI
jgi:hypothetical protein